VSIETSSNINDDIISVIGKTSIKDGFKKNNPQFKIRGIDKSERLNLKNIFNIGFDMNPNQIVCVVDDFITTGSSFRNVFEILPENVKSIGVCLFRLKS
jgi:predicted amidophosphoribosyltransferase